MMGLSTELNSSTYSFVESTYIDISRQVRQVLPFTDSQGLFLLINNKS